MKKLLVVLLIVLIVISGLFVFLKDNLDEIVREIIVTSISEATQTNVSLAQVKLNLKEGVGVLNNYQQGNPVGFQTKYAFRFDQAELDIDVSSILDDVVIIERVFINHANILYEFNDGKTNFVELKKNIDKNLKKKNSDKENKPIGEQDKISSQSKTQQSKKIIIRSFEMINTEVEAALFALQDLARWCMSVIQYLKIGALSTKTGLSIQAIRFYERKALLSAPERTQSNYRSYSDVALKQLMFIKQCRALDMTIEEISLMSSNISKSIGNSVGFSIVIT